MRAACFRRKKKPTTNPGGGFVKLPRIKILFHDLIFARGPLPTTTADGNATQPTIKDHDGFVYSPFQLRESTQISVRVGATKPHPLRRKMRRKVWVSDNSVLVMSSAYLVHALGAAPVGADAS
jgi:hypothetical protein